MTVLTKEIQQQQASIYREYVMELCNLDVYYGNFHAVRDVNMKIESNKITALIGPSGCGKSTVLRCMNRMNDLVKNSRVEGEVLFQGFDLYDARIDPVQVRQRIGMVFQKPNPFPKSIFDNVAYGLRLLGERNRDVLHHVVEQSLKRAALWDEVKGNLKRSGLSLSGGQQQRLCIARTIAIKPEVILMDEPCSALDPIATLKIEDLMRELKEEYTIVIVTHNMQQAARVSDYTAFMMMGEGLDGEIDESRAGELAEFDRTDIIFNNPSNQRTSDYIKGRFG
ncbi:MAG: phosphate ABC transporter ATP-binding protein PstB [Anaerolineae bacterium]|nr:phosphate ABC transporter ATP-binding protein PstB [Anaerolineae bacterium]MDQ7034917.1 phosphate ABC transporter ATP-binding protein PstB [Anaerolineae bacterium]